MTISPQYAGIETDSRWNRHPSWLNVSGILALFVVSVRRLLAGRRLLAILTLFLLPALLTLLIRSHGNHDSPDTTEFFTLLNLLPHSALPFTALLLASGLIQDEVEEQTLTYLLVRPLPRWMVYATKLAAAIVTTALLSSVCTIVNLAVMYGPNIPPEVDLPRRAVVVSFIYALALFAYCGVFGLLGLIFRKSLPMGVVYIIFIEGFLANIPFIVRNATVIYYERVLMLRWLTLHQGANLAWSIDLKEAPSATECVLTLLGIGVAFAAAAGFLFTVREFRVKTPEAT
jgi:ABC-2 type transport system permease protein